MLSDAIGGRKFIAFIICTICYCGLFFVGMKQGILTGDILQSFLFYLIVIQGIFFGGNIAEKFILKNKTEGK